MEFDRKDVEYLVEALPGKGEEFSQGNLRVRVTAVADTSYNDEEIDKMMKDLESEGYVEIINRNDYRNPTWHQIHSISLEEACKAISAVDGYDRRFYRF